MVARFASSISKYWRSILTLPSSMACATAYPPSCSVERSLTRSPSSVSCASTCFLRSSMMPFFSSYRNNSWVASSVRLAPSSCANTSLKRFLILSSSACSLSSVVLAFSRSALALLTTGSSKNAIASSISRRALVTAFSTAC